MRTTRATRLVLLVLAALAALVVVGPPRAGAVTLHGTVSRVVDGDTVKVVVRGFEDTVRLVGIDTPETVAPGRPVGCFGPQASARAARLLPVGGRVVLVTDPTQATRDRYARLLAYVYRPGRRGPVGSVNFALVASGHAKVHVYGGVRFRHAVPFLKAQSRARRGKRGLWGDPCRGDITRPDPSGTTTTAPAPAPPSDPAPAPAPAPAPPAVVAPTDACDPNYAGACIPVSSADLDCGEIPFRNFTVVGSDPHNFDVDHDRIACEE